MRALSWDAFAFVDVVYSSCLSEYFVTSQKNYVSKCGYG